MRRNLCQETEMVKSMSSDIVQMKRHVKQHDTTEIDEKSMSSDIAQMKLRAQQSQVTMMHEITDRKGKGRRLQVVGDAPHAFNPKAKGTGWVAEIFLYITCSLRSSHRASISKGSIEIRGLTHFVDVPPQCLPNSNRSIKVLTLSTKLKAPPTGSRTNTTAISTPKTYHRNL